MRASINILNCQNITMVHFFRLLLEDIYFKSLCIHNSFLAHIHLVNFLIFNLKLLRQFITRNNKDFHNLIMTRHGGNRIFLRCL